MISSEFYADEIQELYKYFNRENIQLCRRARRIVWRQIAQIEEYGSTSVMVNTEMVYNLVK